MGPAQPVHVNGDVSRATRHFHAFMRRVLTIPHLQDPQILRQMAYRYEAMWLPLKNANRELAMLPPLDVYLMWHAHMTSPISYNRDCTKLCGELIGHQYAATAVEEKSAVSLTLSIWKKEYGAGSFSLKPEDAHLIPLHHTSALSLDLVARAQDLLRFYYQVALPHYNTPSWIDAALVRYKQFMGLYRTYPKRELIPPPDVAMIWLVHSTMPTIYVQDIWSAFGSLLDCNLPGGEAPLDSAIVESSSHLWQTAFDESYSGPGLAYRGLPPPLERQHADDLTATAAVRYKVRIDSAEIVGLESPRRSNFSIHFTRADYRLRVRPFWEVFKLSGPERQWTSRQGHSLAEFTFETHVFNYLYVTLNGYRGFSFFAREHLTGHRLYRFLSDPGKGPETGSKMWTITLKSVETKCEISNIEIHLSGTVTPEKLLGWTMHLVEDVPLRLVPDDRAVWGPVQLPAGTCQTGTQISLAEFSAVNQQNATCYKVHVLHGLEPAMSAILTRDTKGQVVCMAQLIGESHLPPPDKVTDKRKCVTLDPSRGERAMLISDGTGDWAIVVARWVVYRWGRLRNKILRHNPGFLHVKLHNLREQKTYMANMPYRRNHNTCFRFNYTLGNLEGGLQDTYMRIKGDRDAANFVTLGCVIPLLWTLIHPRPQQTPEGEDPPPEAEVVDTTEDGPFIPRVKQFREKERGYYRAWVLPIPGIVKASSLQFPRLMGFAVADRTLTIPTNDYIRATEEDDALGGFYTNKYLHWDDQNSDGDFGGRIPDTESVGKADYSFRDADGGIFDDDPEEDSVGTDGDPDSVSVAGISTVSNKDAGDDSDSGVDADRFQRQVSDGDSCTATSSVVPY